MKSEHFKQTRDQLKEAINAIRNERGLLLEMLGELTIYPSKNRFSGVDSGQPLTPAISSKLKVLLITAICELDHIPNVQAVINLHFTSTQPPKKNLVVSNSDTPVMPKPNPLLM